jgi:hypothetical protein
MSDSSVNRPYVVFPDGSYLTYVASIGHCVYSKAGVLLAVLEYAGVVGTLHSGTVTITAGQSSVVLAHGLGRTPFAIVSHKDANLNGIPFTWAIDGTNLTVTMLGTDVNDNVYAYVLI